MAAPDDVVGGADPAYGDTIKVEIVKAAKTTCKCGFSTVVVLGSGDSIQMIDHLRLAHPAVRNPELTCHATPMWDHERWCVRAKGHDGDHWTPSINGGAYWKAH